MYIYFLISNEFQHHDLSVFNNNEVIVYKSLNIYLFAAFLQIGLQNHFLAFTT